MLPLSDGLLWSREAFAFGSPCRKRVGWSSATVTSAALLVLQAGGDGIGEEDRSREVAKWGQPLAWLLLQAQIAPPGSTRSATCLLKGLSLLGVLVAARGGGLTGDR